MAILVTGSTGFVGQALCHSLVHSGHIIRCAVRVGPKYFLSKENRKTANKNNFVAIDDIGPSTNWLHTLQDIDTVIHLAARVHSMQGNSEYHSKDFQEVNTLGTAHLAGEAAKAGVSRFVYLSSIKVNGDETGQRGQKSKTPFSETDIPNPQDSYAISKWEAEQALNAISNETGMEVVIIRSPLVYGPGVKANFLRLLRVIDRSIPLPLGSLHNARSLVNIDNLIDFLITCIKHPAAAGETFLTSDGKDLSIPELIEKIARYMGRPCRLLPTPPSLLRFVGKLVGKEYDVKRLCASLQVDITKARNVLGWEPPVSVDEGLKKTVEWYLKQKAVGDNQ